MPSTSTSKSVLERKTEGLKEESADLIPQHYEITQKFFPLFVKAHEEQLQKIEKNFKVNVSREVDDGKVIVAPTEHCTAEEYHEGCEAFISLYQNAHKRMTLEVFILRGDKPTAYVRQRVRDMGKAHPVLVEVCEDREHWKVYGEDIFVENVLSYLQKERLISRTAREAETWSRDGTDEGDAEIENDNQLEHKLAQRMPSTSTSKSVLERKTVGLNQARGAFASELEGKLGIDYAQLRPMLDNEVQLRNKVQELRQKEIHVKELQEKLRKEQQTKRRIEEELSRARSAFAKKEERFQAVSQFHKQELREQRLAMELERQQKTTLEETLRRLRLQNEEERNRHVSTERELQSDLSAKQRELTELQRRETRDWIIQREEITMSGNILGKGAWGIVCEGTFRSSKVAVKEIHELILSDHNRRLFEREMNIASCCRHPNLLQFIGATNDNGSPLFVTELLDTSLRQLLSKRALHPDEVIKLALDLAKGLNYLHLNKPIPIIHRDISSANVLLWRRDECWRAKLSDYGAANFMRQCMTEKPGAMIYSAPEAFTRQQSPKVDVYSFGVLLCEMCIRELPIPQDRPNQIKQVPHNVLRGLIQRCVQRDPEKRPTMGEVIRDLEQLRV